MINLHFLEDHVLPFVEKPSRYTGGEINSIIKSHEGKTSLALIYPDIYEIGISNLGLRLLYDIVNQDERFVCERAYTPWLDMEKLLRENHLPLYSLETKTPLKEFNVLGFSFQYELLYTNFLTILDLAGIPFFSKERDETYPLIIAGGPVTGNIEPIANFLDAVCVGDGESAIIEILSVVHNHPKDRQKLLEHLSAIPGVYVPSLYSLKKQNGYLIPYGKPVHLRTETSLDSLPFATKQIIPHCEAIQDRAVIEVSRGCTRGCRFCQAGIHYRPIRERCVSTILELAKQTIQNTGYREFSLISLSISDYSRLSDLLPALHKQFSCHGISFSLPSLRLDSFTLELAKSVQEIRKSGLTFAVEGGTDTIRKIINKTVSHEDLIEVIAIAQQFGWRSVKLYFMIGLPYTTPDEEIQGIQNLLEILSERFPKITLTASVAVFIPKPHTPFQWAGQMLPDQALLYFQKLINSFRKNRRIHIRYNHPHLSFLEGIFAHGDRQLDFVIIEAWKHGARFDSWNDHIQIELWNTCFHKLGIDPLHYILPKKTDTPLPWQIITTVSADFLKKENEKAKKHLTSQDCRNQCFHQCKICDFQVIRPQEAKESEISIDPNFLSNIFIDAKPTHVLRFTFEKTKTARYLSPTDIEEALSRAVIRANLPICYTQGFNPHFRFAFLWALPLGIESMMEIAEVSVSKFLSPEEWIERFNTYLPHGLSLTKAKVLPLGTPSLSQLAKTHFCEIAIQTDIPLYQSITDIPKTLTFTKRTKSKEKSLYVLPYLRHITITNKQTFITFFLTDGGLRIQDVVEVITGQSLPHMLLLKPTIVRRFVIQNDKEISLFDL